MGVQIPLCEGAILGERAASCKVEGCSAVSCAKVAELIEIPFGMLSQVDPGNYVLDGGANALTGRGTYKGVSSP